jgi:hypothetical protein
VHDDVLLLFGCVKVPIYIIQVFACVNVLVAHALKDLEQALVITPLRFVQLIAIVKVDFSEVKLPLVVAAKDCLAIRMLVE